MDIETLLSIIGIATLISVYIIFVTWWSLNKRAKFAKELDEYLGNDSNPECYKRILVHFV